MITPTTAAILKKFEIDFEEESSLKRKSLMKVKVFSYSDTCDLFD